MRGLLWIDSLTDTNDSIEQSLDSITSSCLRQARAGNDHAWQRLVALHHKLVCWWCAKSGIPRSDIDDLAQEVFAGAYASFASFEHQSFRGWLWRITKNKIVDYWRRRQKETTAQGGSSIQELLDQVEAASSQRVGAVDRATKLVFDAVVALVQSEFSERDWRAFWDVAVEGMPVAEAAHKHGITRNQVYLAKSRIRRRIREEFDEMERDS